MERIGQWCITLCVVCLTTGVLFHILPDGRIKQCVNITYALLLLTSVISIFGNADTFDIDIEYSENIIEAYDYDLYSYVTDMANKKIKEEINNSLDSICKYDYSVESNWIQNENTYKLSEITITLYREDYQNSNKIKSIIGSLTGVIPEVKMKDEIQ